jgi:hypothetical protein
MPDEFHPAKYRLKDNPGEVVEAWQVEQPKQVVSDTATTTAAAGDWIVRTARGNETPVPAQIFHDTYEPAPPED